MDGGVEQQSPQPSEVEDGLGEEKEPVYISTRSITGTILYGLYGSWLLGTALWWILLVLGESAILYWLDLLAALFTGAVQVLVAGLLLIQCVPHGYVLSVYTNLRWLLIYLLARILYLHVRGRGLFRELIVTVFPRWHLLPLWVFGILILIGAYCLSFEGRWLNRLRPFTLYILEEPLEATLQEEP